MTDRDEARRIAEALFGSTPAQPTPEQADAADEANGPDQFDIVKLVRWHRGEPEPTLQPETRAPAELASVALEQSVHEPRPERELLSDHSRALAGLFASHDQRKADAAFALIGDTEQVVTGGGRPWNLPPFGHARWDELETERSDSDPFDPRSR